MDTLTKDQFDDLRGALRGQLLQPHDAGYDAARTLWNAMIVRRPAVIVRCAGVADVRAALAFARDHQMALAVRGGGHNIAGSALCDDGLVIDLSAMRSVQIDPDQRRAVANAGIAGNRIVTAGGNGPLAVDRLDRDVLGLSGVKVAPYKVAIFTLAGAFYGLAGVMVTSQLSAGLVQAGKGYDFAAITAAVVGGTLLTGGRGGILHSAVGVLLVTVLTNGLVQIGVSPYWQGGVQGLIVVAAVAAAVFPQRRRNQVTK